MQRTQAQILLVLTVVVTAGALVLSTQLSGGSNDDFELATEIQPAKTENSEGDETAAAAPSTGGKADIIGQFGTVAKTNTSGEPLGKLEGNFGGKKLERFKSGNFTPPPKTATKAAEPAPSPKPEEPKPAPTPEPPRPTEPPATEAPAPEPEQVQEEAASLAGNGAFRAALLKRINSLRTRPGGPDKRVKGVPACARDQVNPKTKLPAAVGAVKLSGPVSDSMALAWAVEMDKIDSLRHRSNESAESIYKDLGIAYTTFGENIAWNSGTLFEDKPGQAADIFFEQWRESDGHYCNMISSSFTHVGLGIHFGPEKTWGVQNFFGQ